MSNGDGWSPVGAGDQPDISEKIPHKHNHSVSFSEQPCKRKLAGCYFCTQNFICDVAKKRDADHMMNWRYEHEKWCMLHPGKYRQTG